MIMPGLTSGVDTLRRNWGWFLVLGITLTVLGGFAMSSSGVTTVASMALFGWFIFFNGILEAIASLRSKYASGFFMHILAGLLYAVTGLLMVSHPIASAVGATLILAGLFLTGGLFRVVVAATSRYPNWGWTVFDGAVSIILGGLTLFYWETASLWMIGTFIGINLIFRGLAWMMLAVAAKRIPPMREQPPARQAVHEYVGY